MKFRAIAVILVLMVTACQKTSTSTEQVFTSQDLRQTNTVLLEGVMDGAFSPPVASRIYAYSHLANYIITQSFYKDSLVDISSKLNGLKLDIPENKENVNPELAGLLAFSNIGKKLIYAEHFFNDHIDTLQIKALNYGLSQETIDASLEYANKVSKQLSAWIDKDMYIETRTYDRFTSTKKPENWRETPPDYATALEPHWNKIRPLVIDNPDIYKPKPLPVYDTAEDSDFFKMVKEVYDESLNTTEEKGKIAWFWDCNPILTVHKGHMMTTIHKYPPPGHWMNIITQVSQKEASDYFTTTKAYTLTSMAMFDAIICSWHIKYTTDLVRPITYIQEFIDPDWEPVLQTPPFPEYTSGHSATSASAAEILTSIYGDNYAFTDNTQLRFGLEQRSFSSFKEAADQVNLSRFYGGIHYMQGVEEGAKQGAFVASAILKKIYNE
ncbi:vanadium-dependent haloperoxidase [Hanstruepera flava]|uniref:vanadium-dependent haloperoxidase n=1 Tax=Hanstruepera flava TaxID=2930218 RepID=UPI002027E9F9|nr:vanadium-dependent haloperoxidase [Hanstruepera flava]